MKKKILSMLDALCGECHGTKVRFVDGRPCSRCVTVFEPTADQEAAPIASPPKTTEVPPGKELILAPPKTTIYHRLSFLPRWTLVIPRGLGYNFHLSDHEEHPLLFASVPREVELIADLIDPPPADARVRVTTNGWPVIDMLVNQLPSITSTGLPTNSTCSSGYLNIDCTTINWTLREGEHLSIALRADNETFKRAKCPCNACQEARRNFPPHGVDFRR